MYAKQIEQIHESLINGQRKQAVNQIDDYGNSYDFWADYKEYLNSLYPKHHSRYVYFTDLCISYFRIKNR